jgi:hypothetical protein
MLQNCVTVAKLHEEGGAEDAEGRGSSHGAQAVQVGGMFLNRCSCNDTASI